MGLLDGLLGNASKIDNASIEDEFAPLLAPGERVEHAYKLIRDYFVFTNRRLVLVDKQGLTGSKVEYRSIPYRNITHFSVETAGSFDLDAELKIWISGTAAPIQKTFNKKLSIYEAVIRSRAALRAISEALPTAIASSARPVVVWPYRSMARTRILKVRWAAPTAAVAPSRAATPRCRVGASAAPAMAPVAMRASMPAGTMRSGADFILSPASSPAASVVAPIVARRLPSSGGAPLPGGNVRSRAAWATVANGVIARMPATAPMRTEWIRAMFCSFVEGRGAI